MARRVSPSQLRQAQARQRQALSRYNAEVRRAVNDHNRKARAHNARVRANRDRLRPELHRLSRTPTRTTVRHAVYRRSVVTLQESFSRLEAIAEADAWSGDDEMFDLSEGEAANSVAVLNAMIAESPQGTPSEHEIAELQATTIGDELARIDSDLDQRWRGALFALHPDNPDASRHFCSSSREMLDDMLKQAAPDDDVLAASPHAPRTEQGSPTRHSRVVHCLHRRGSFDESLAAFIDADIENVVTLFRQFNDGTHGHAGRFDLVELRALKLRVEDAVRFVTRITAE